MTDDDSGLDRLFQSYRAACSEVEPGSNFMPGVWQKIEARRSFWLVFQRPARAIMTASAALCVLLVLLNVVSSAQHHVPAPTYVDALMAEHSAENTYYTEAIRQ
jgi:hypothetical protein